MNQDEQSSFAARVQRQLYQLVRNYELCDQVCLAQHGVTASQGYTLLSLPQEGALTMNELSEAMEVASSTMTRMVDQLVSKGLVHRRPDKEDRRIVRVQLTAQGQVIRRTLDKALQEFFKQALEAIPEDERPAILHALEQVTKPIVKALEACGGR
jgi:DNA-binding MarR family transcriptional regulator